MSARIRRGTSVVRSVARVAQEREITFLAASLSYYTFVSLIPLLVTALVVAAIVGGEALQDAILALAEEYLLPTAREQVRGIIVATAAGGGVGVVGFAISVWGALKMFRALDTAFSRVYDSDPGSFLDQVRDGVVALGAIAVGVAGVVVLGAVIAVLRVPFLALLGPFLLFATLAVAFFPLYYVFPDTDVGPREVLPGTLFAAVGWTVLGSVFGAYARFAAASGYGLLGAVLLLVTWFYFGGSVILLGAVVNVVLADRQMPRLRTGRSGGGDRAERSRSARDERERSDGPERDGVSPGERTGRARPPAGSEPTGADVTAGRIDRQLQQDGVRGWTRMATDETDARAERRTPAGAPDLSELDARVKRLQSDLESFEEDIESRTVEKPEVEQELKQYVRKRLRRGHARGWGPYLVLLYGTVMTLGAFYWLEGWVALAAMLVVFLSTLGLYAVFLMVGAGLGTLIKTGEVADRVRNIR